MTVTANIHYNCPAWSNHTFALGKACSNVGNGYRCITAGTSTVAPTGTSADSAPGGTAHFRYLSAIDYTDLPSWHAALAPLSDHVVVEVWNNGEITTPPGVSFLQTRDDAGFTTNGFTITIRAAPGDSFKEKVSTTPLTYNASNGTAFRITGVSGGADYTAFFFGMNNVILDGIQFKCDDSVGMSMLVANGSANGFVLRNCIVDFPAQPGAQWALDFDCSCSLYNNLLIDRQDVSGTGVWSLFAYSGFGAISFLNNTLIAVNAPSGGIGIWSNHFDANQLLVRNCALFGYGQPLNSGNIFGAIFTDHCCTDVSSFGNSADNGNEQFSKTATNQFVSPIVDFRLKAGSSCLNTGVSDLVNVPTGNDIYRTTRPQGVTWDIGAHELIAASAAVGSAAGVGAATARTGTTFPTRGVAAGVGSAAAIAPSIKLIVGSASGVGRATGIPPVTSGVGAVTLLTDINETNCVSLTPTRLPATIDPPPFRLRLAYQHNNTVMTSDLNATIASSRVQFLASPDTYASWSSNLISRTYTRPNDPAPFGGALLILNEAQLVVNDLGDLFGGRSRLYDAELPVAFGLQFDIGDVVKLTYPMDDLRNGRVGRVVGEQFRSGEPTLRLRVLVTADSRIIGPDPPTLVTIF